MKKGILLVLSILMLGIWAEIAQARVYVDFSISSYDYFVPAPDYVVVERVAHRPHYRHRHHRHHRRHYHHYYQERHYYPVEYVDYYYPPRYVRRCAPRYYYDDCDDCWGW